MLIVLRPLTAQLAPGLCGAAACDEGLTSPDAVLFWPGTSSTRGVVAADGLSGGAVNDEPLLLTSDANGAETAFCASVSAVRAAGSAGTRDSLTVERSWLPNPADEDQVRGVRSASAMSVDDVECERSLDEVWRVSVPALDADITVGWSGCDTEPGAPTARPSGKSASAR